MVLHQLVKTGSEVVPHNELAEGEQPEICKIEDVPAALVHYSLTHGIEHKRCVHTILVLGQRIKACYVYAVILP